MEETAGKFWSVGTLVSALIYTFYLPLKLPKGPSRLLAISPVVVTLLYLPWQISSIHFRAISCFLFLWLALFKLLLLCFDVGPAVTPWALQNPVHFVTLIVFPINVSDSKSQKHRKGNPRLVFLQLFLLSLIIYSYRFRDSIPQKFILLLYCFHLYFSLNIVLECLRAPLNAFFKLDLAEQFNRPDLSSSLQDFWGRRWNLVVTSILRESVYNPLLNFIMQKVGRNGGPTAGRQKAFLWAKAIAVLATFVVSGLMHELIFYYIIREKPSWEQTSFFVVHGLLVVIEMVLKKTLSPYFELPEFISSLLTLGLLYVTAVWLFFPPITRSGIDLRTIAEYNEIGRIFWGRNLVANN